MAREVPVALAVDDFATHDSPPTILTGPSINGATARTSASVPWSTTDGVASSSIRLLKLAQLFSFSFALLTMLFLGLIVVLLLSRSYETETLLFLVGYILVAAGNFTITICLYILGAYVGRTYLEAKGRPAYLIMEIIGSE